MAGFDFDAARRWARFDPKGPLARRADEDLPFVDAGRLGGQALLLDTCVYIDQMQGRAPRLLDDVIARRQVNHSTVVIQELMHTVGVLNPSDPRTPDVVAEIGRQIRAMPRTASSRPTPRFSDGRRCCRASSVVSGATRRAAGCGRSPTASCSSRHRSSAWWC